MSESHERRTEPRIEQLHLSNVAAWPRVGDAGPIDTGRTLDISRSGMRLEVHLPIPLSSVLSFSLALGENVLRIRGIVRYVERLDDGNYAIGVRFEKVGQADQAVLDHHLPA